MDSHLHYRERAPMSARRFVAAGLIRYLRAKGERSMRSSRDLSGFDPARAGDSDCGVLLRALGLPLSEEEIEDISPWRFARAALARHGGASRRQGDRFRAARIVLRHRDRGSRGLDC